ncbi:hypothetical protein C8P63_14211 [Melghirimyces profundicolus]|uniref:Outer membrane lipoprotein-sorting protein n=1 Tax=Melghirimyces profundicolus TaxID=1242148 RepID=A0A2T6AZA6_9BACL|nr:hypothetical protein [Melghirimyces profundicolus]PTX49154.1 hypothetical protein C8P63_14211 [Melghirimyces profundicolus]
MPRWVKLGLCLCLAGILASGTAGCFSGSGRETGGSPPVQPGLRGEVPRLEELIGQKGLKEYTLKRPYLLGYSYDGTYMATVVYDKEADAYRIDLFHTASHRREETVYAPAEISTSVKSATLETGSKSAEEELLSLTQETLDLGYRIKVPLVYREYFLQQKIRTQGDQNLELSLRREGRAAVLNASDGKNRWRLTRFQLREGEKLADRWMISSPPSPGNKWTVVASARSTEGRLRPLVHTLDTALLSKSWAEKRLQERVKTVLGNGARIVFREETTDDGGPETLLAVRGEKPFLSGSPEGVRYAAAVDRFVILDGERKVRFRGNSAGLVRDEKIRLDPSLPEDRKSRFRLLLTVGEQNGEPVRVLTVDQLTFRGEVVRTYELIWNHEKKAFEYKG